MKKNITITLDPEMARWARVEAAKRLMSLSRFMAELLADRMRQESSYEESMRRFLAREVAVINEKACPYPAREDLHDRND